MIVHDRPSGEPPELLARPRGLPSPGLDPLAPWSSSGYANDAEAASFATNEANSVQAQTDRAPATPTPRHVQTGPNTRDTTSQTIGSRTFRTSPSPAGHQHHHQIAPHVWH